MTEAFEKKLREHVDGLREAGLTIPVRVKRNPLFVFRERHSQLFIDLVQALKEVKKHLTNDHKCV